MINLLLKLVGYQIVKSKTLNDLRNQLLLSKDPTEYERWFSSVFGVQVPVPGALIATSWSGNDRWGIRAHYALMDIEFEYVKELLKEISRLSIEGSIVEFGVYNGWWLEKLYELSQSVGFERDIYGFDSFEGLPEPSLLDDSTFWKKGMYAGDYEEVKRRLRTAERKRIHLIKGWFKDAFVSDEAKAVSKISYARIDCDLYESAVECLNYLSSRLTDGAILVFDDWPHRITHGEGKAFAEWLPTVPNLAFEFIFYNTWGHLYLRVRHRAKEASHSTPTIENYLLIQQNLVGSMLAKHDRVVNRLLPGNTKRRGAYDLALTGVRTIVNEGWRSFGSKFRQWLEQRRMARQVIREHPPEILSISDPFEDSMAYVLRTSDEIKESKEVKIDLTGRFDYKRLCQQEVQHYSAIEVTQALTEGGVHAQKAWGFWFRYLSDNVWKTSFNKEVIDFCNSVDSPKILSLGCGYGGIELSIAKGLKKPYGIIATDINRTIFAKAIQEASKNDINIRFIPLDLNFVEIRKDSFDAIIASASLHHLLNLEHVFDQVYKGLKEDGRFIIQDVIGQRQVLFWKENVEFASNVIRQLPSRYKKGISEESLPHYNEPDLQIGMEGIRQEEIEFELNKYFTPVKLFKYGSFMRLICTHPIIGKLLDPDNIEDKKVLESLCNLDIQKVEQKELRPTEMFGVFRKKSRSTGL